MKLIYRVVLYPVILISSIIISWHILYPIVVHYRTQYLQTNTETPPYFPILTNATENNNYQITYFKDLSSKYIPVTKINKANVTKINKVIGQGIPYGKIKIIRTKSNYTDICLVAHNPEWVKGWYRIQNGNITPQKYHMYTRGLYYGLCPTAIFSGIFFSILVMIIINHKNRNKNNSSENAINSNDDACFPYK